jgi:tetratricopeptide (TPR) repeat protein
MQDGRSARTEILPVVPRNRVGARWSGVFILALLLGGCAMSSDRTRELLAMDLADRSAAVARLEADDRSEPAAWRAYTLGVLAAEDEDYPRMAAWFARCAERGRHYDADMEAVRSRHWKRWAEAADLAFADGRYAEAESLCAVALVIDPTQDDTKLRRTEAAVMAHGPTPADVALLTAAGRTAAVDRWLERTLAGGMTAPQRRLVAARLAAEPTFPIGAFALGELARADGDYAAMGRWYDKTANLLDARHQAVMAANREAAQDRFMNDALAAWAVRDDAAAGAAFAAAEAVRPGDAGVAEAGRLAALLGRAAGDEAVAKALEDPALDDAWLQAWLMRLYTANRYADAVLVADHILRPVHRAPADVARQARRVRASALVAEARWDAAAHDLLALLTPPSGNRAADASAAMALGDVLLAGSRWDDAARWYATAERWVGPSADLHKRQARAAFGAGRLEELDRHSRAAAAMAPADPEARDLANQAALVPAGGRSGR